MDTELKRVVLEVLDKGYLMSLATFDDGGVWVSDVIYTYDNDLNTYWMSYSDVRHSKAILTNPVVAGSITSSGPHESDLGIQLVGTVTKLEGDRPDILEKYVAKKEVCLTD